MIQLKYILLLEVSFLRNKRMSLIFAIISTVLILNFIIISVFIAFNQFSYNSLAQKQSHKVLSLLYERTALYFNDLLDEADSFNELFCDQISYGSLFLHKDLSKVENLSIHLTDNLKKRYPQVGVIGYGDEQGRYLGLRINDDDTVNLMLKDSRNNNKLTIYASDNVTSDILVSYNEYDPRLRPWYMPVKDTPVNQWSDIYVNYDEIMNLTISVMCPIFYQNKFYGVVTSDVSLNLINSYLKSDKEIGNGVIYLLDKDNNILAHSQDESYINVTEGDPPTYNLMSALNVDNPIISNSAKYIVYNNVSNDVFSFDLQNKRYYGFIGNISKPFDQGIRAVIAIPEDDLLSDIKKQQFQSLLTVIFIICLSTVLGIWVLSRIIQPIEKAAFAAKALSNGDFSVNVDEGKLKLYETQELVDSFNHMALKLNNAFSTIKENEASLESKVKEKTNELQKTYDELLEREKLASLGGLVAGISHEINTPLGVAVSACSYLEKQHEILYNSLISSKISKENLINYLESTEESIDIININLLRAAELISSFKQISVNQSASVHSKFFVKDYFESIFLTLKHEYKNKPFEFNIYCDDELEIYSYPGSISQIFTNLIMNSLKHGFKDETLLSINIYIDYDDNWVTMKYTDNGNGIPPGNLKHIFEPFFTTKRNDGGSGLGLSIVYNIVTATLGGTITCESELNKGVLFTIRIPKSV